MTIDQLVTALLGGSVGALAAAALVRLRLIAPAQSLMRINVNGRRVPAVLGAPLSLAALTALLVVTVFGALGWPPGRTGRIGAAVAVIVALLSIAGSWDDRRGDEAPRGFGGHLGALRAGRVTGGIVKLVGGAGAGLLAGAIVAGGWAALEVGAIVALTANLVNLLDRAPGRAGKAALLGAVPLLVFGPPAWMVASAGLLGGLTACLPADLQERAMLGDAGANPVGGVLGLGLAVALDDPFRLVALGVLAALNVASERVSFSRVIERNRVLRAADRWGVNNPRRR